MQWSKFDVETPALLLDLDALEANIARMAAFFRGRPAALRPHCKTHKSVRIAQMQLAAGARGITCQKLGEAEVMAHGGIHDVLITNEIVGVRKIGRLMALANEADVTVCVDAVDNVRDLSIAAAFHGAQVGVLVEVDVGMHRCGVVSAEDALSLARLVQSSPGLTLRGLQGYEGHAVMKPTAEERRRLALESMDMLTAVATYLREHGIPVEMLAAGGTGTFDVTGAYPGITDVEAGSYATMDARYAGIGTPFTPALSVLATVVSRARPDILVVDCGLKGITQEFGLPVVCNVPGATIAGLSEEHAKITLSDPSQVMLKPGDTLELWPSHGCTTINLYNHYVACRGDRVEALWPVDARGRVT